MCGGHDDVRPYWITGVLSGPRIKNNNNNKLWAMDEKRVVAIGQR